jgi:hypothetical protein
MGLVLVAFVEDADDCVVTAIHDSLCDASANEPWPYIKTGETC